MGLVGRAELCEEEREKKTFRRRRRRVRHSEGQIGARR